MFDGQQDGAPQNNTRSVTQYLKDFVTHYCKILLGTTGLEPMDQLGDYYQMVFQLTIFYAHGFFQLE